MGLFHIYETTGKMTEIVNKFLRDVLLTNEELETLKKYLIQWIAAMPIKPRHYQFRIANMNQVDLMKYIHELNEMGIDPFNYFFWSNDFRLPKSRADKKFN